MVVSMPIKQENYIKIRQHFIKLLGRECNFCHTKDNLEFDHIIPCKTDMSKMSRSKREWHWFDEYAKGNLQLLCAECNNKKNDSMPLYFSKEGAIL